MTKKQQGMLNAYNHATMKSIHELYKKPSWRKENAEYQIQKYMKECNGYDYRVIGGNCSTFSCAFKYKDDNGKEHLRYYTRYNTYDFIIA